ncbi:YveK family protein [Nocardioides jiangxiensis]|uniref:Wzz/FepE/Etk N-terminal domain-containing protein n=1 Tax=Nocardioides jiangxiensis TaxID=3064524 RepID=A0ABT9B2T1_9ACTN|nr:Wzz/FepE/Etk N-terminal domain-containing protein [Nocardioides sp. WY-20]MDO7869003.1 Wzz/FepE/Etk N-terminal domain-containing protein [Nocardioides sp. WY-20]
MDLRTYVGVLLRNWVLILLAIVLGLAAAGAVALFGTSRYTSTARILFSASQVDTGQDLAYAGNYVQSRMQTYKGLATTPAVLDKVIDELDLDTTPAELAKQISVETSQIDTLIGVTAESTDKREAARIADSVSTQLIGAVVGVENSGASDKEPGVRGVVVGRAVVAKSPSSPDVPVDLLAGLLLGAFVGVGAVTARHLLRDPESA